jgi:hypothetical protein
MKNVNIENIKLGFNNIIVSIVGFILLLNFFIDGWPMFNLTNHHNKDKAEIFKLALVCSILFIVS